MLWVVMYWFAIRSTGFYIICLKHLLAFSSFFREISYIYVRPVTAGQVYLVILQTYPACDNFGGSRSGSYPVWDVWSRWNAITIKKCRTVYKSSLIILLNAIMNYIRVLDKNILSKRICPLNIIAFWRETLKGLQKFGNETWGIIWDLCIAHTLNLNLWIITMTENSFWYYNLFAVVFYITNKLYLFEFLAWLSNYIHFKPL